MEDIKVPENPNEENPDEKEESREEPQELGEESQKEFVNPFTPEELAKIDELESYVPYIRSIKLFYIQKNNPKFYAKMVKYFPAEEDKDEIMDYNFGVPPDRLKLNKLGQECNRTLAISPYKR